jgi:hypothetical protein
MIPVVANDLFNAKLSYKIPKLPHDPKEFTSLANGFYGIAKIPTYKVRI